MNEGSARALLEAHAGKAGFERLEWLHDLIVTENERQNLVSRGSIDSLWSRHILDSVQLIALAASAGRWLDIGTGGGFPGLVVAAVDDRPMTLVEPRRRRAEFLRSAATTLGLDHVTVEPCQVETLRQPAETISARAVASVEKLLQAAHACATPRTRWLLPRGRLDDGEVTALRRRHGDKVFHVKQSVSDPTSSILVVMSRSAGE